MNDFDLVSVVVPVYKVEKYLDRCIKSIVNQTYSNLEIILVDDGSPDRCPQMCEEWAQRDKRIKVIHKENAGLGMARNTGLDNASGDYVCFVDSDDYVDATLIEKSYHAIIESQADLAIFGLKSVNTEGNVIREYIPQGDKEIVEGESIQMDFLPDMICNDSFALKYTDLCLSSCTCMYSMTLIRRCGWHFVSERKIISEDSYSLIQLFRSVQRVVLLHDAPYYYCMNEASLTHEFRVDRFEKYKEFYQSTMTLAQQMNYCPAVLDRIAGLFLSFLIAAMKQIAASQIGWNAQYNNIKKIVMDQITQDALETAKYRRAGFGKNMLYAMMREKQVLAVWVLVAMKQRTQRNHR